MKLFLLVNIVCFAFAGCPQQKETTAYAPPRLDSALLINHLRILSAADMEGRETGTRGNKKAQDYIIKQFSALSTQQQAFPLGDSVQGLNILATLKGSKYPDSFIVVTAHYDHIGIQNDKIFYGADDNASGTAALLTMAKYFSTNRPQHSILFIAFDAEEKGLLGSKYFAANPTLPLQQVTMNLNMDMVSRNDKNEIYASGTFHYPFLKKYVDSIRTQTPVNILFGHDDASKGGHDDWTSQSDHYSFHQKQIPFLYFGVEDHADYHRPGDTFDKINKQFYYQVCQAITGLVVLLDKQPALR